MIGHQQGSARAPPTQQVPVRWVLWIMPLGAGRCRKVAPAAGQMLEGHYRGGRLGPWGLCLFPPQGSSRARGEAAA